MKGKFIISLVFLLGILLSSCSLGESDMFGIWRNSDQQMATDLLEDVLDAIQNQDKETLKSLFSKDAVTSVANFDESMDCLFDYYRGEFVSYDDWGGPGVEQSVDNGRKKKEMYSTYDIKTSEQMYRIAIQSFTVDTANPNNVGIWSLYIIKAEDDEDPYSAYRGDGKYTPGIHINIK